MRWIKEFSESEATGAVKTAYEDATRFSGNPKVGPIIKVFSLPANQHRRGPCGSPASLVHWSPECCSSLCTRR